MLFANKKEEVLDIELTPHGRYLLSLGKLKPVYYSFHDSNILYDGRYAGFEELSKEIEDRIQHNTPQPKVMNSRVSREKNSRKIFSTDLALQSGLNRATELATVAQMNEQKTSLTTHPIGSSSPTTDLAPVWSVKVLNGEISGSVPYLTSSFQTLRIPQIDIDVKYKTAILSVSEPDVNFAMKPDPVLTSMIFSDGTYAVVDPDHLLLEVLEENTEYTNTNFEVEVFQVEQEKLTKSKAGLTGTETLQENLRPLFFRKPVDNIVDNILLDDSELPKPASIPDSPAMVNYYFNVFVDEEIDLADICEAKQTFENKNLFVDLDVVCPPDGVTPTRYNVYTGPSPVPACPTPERGVGDEACDD